MSDKPFETSPETEKLDAAIAKAQGELSNAIKNKVNPHYKSPYADLAAVWEACREALTKNQISLMQFPVHSGDQRLHLVTRVAHGGQWILSHYSIPVGKQDVHGYGSALTYIKRQALKAIIGIADEEDDDGQKALPVPRPNHSRRQAPQQSDFAPPDYDDVFNSIPGGPQSPEEAAADAVDAQDPIANWKLPMGQFLGFKLKEMGHEGVIEYLPKLKKALTSGNVPREQVAMATEMISKMNQYLGVG